MRASVRLVEIAPAVERRRRPRHHGAEVGARRLVRRAPVQVPVGYEGAVLADLRRDRRFVLSLEHRLAFRFFNRSFLFIFACLRLSRSFRELFLFLSPLFFGIRHA